MININSYIIEKLKLNKDSKADDDILNFNELISHICNNIELKTNEAEEILKEKCFNNVNLTKYKYMYIDPQKYQNNHMYKLNFEWGETLVKDKNAKIDDFKKIYTFNIIDLSIYLYTNYNLSDNDGDEYYIYLIDRMNKKYYIYEFIKDGNRNILELK